MQQHCIPANNFTNFNIFITYAVVLHIYRIPLQVNSNNKRNMAKKKNQNHREKLEKKSAVESLKFQTHFGLRQLGRADSDTFHVLADAEVNVIAELGLTDDILGVKNLTEGIKRDLNVEPTTDKGDFCTSVVAIALGIARISDLDHMAVPVSWEEQIEKKILTIYYPEEWRNGVVEWAKANGYNTSTYLGRPIVKFNKLFVIIERERV